MVSKPSAQELALACGVAGAYVDVTDDIVTDSVKGTWGRTSGFSDTRPGVFSFDLVNDAGKYTPDNTASSLSTTVHVGMGVHHIVDGMHFAGTIRSTQPYFTGASGLSGSSKLRVTCDDMLGNAARRELGELSDGLVEAGAPYMWWTLGEPAGSPVAVDRMLVGPPMSTTAPGQIGGIATFGAVAVPGLPTTQLTVTDSAAAGGFFGNAPGSFPVVAYAVGSLGVWGCWIAPATALTIARFGITYRSIPGGTVLFNLGVDAVTQRARLTTTTVSSTLGSAVALGAPHFYSAVVSQATVAGTTTIYVTPYVDGVAFSSPVVLTSFAGAALTNTQAVASDLQLVVIGSVGNGEYANFSNLSHTATGPVAQELLLTNTETARLSAIAASVPEIVLDTLPATLATAPLGPAETDGQATLDALNDVIRTEQGYMWTETTGTLTAPVQKIKVRARDRGETIDAAHTFTVSEIQNAPEFVTDIENMVSSAIARGPINSATVFDPTLTPYVGSASDSTSVLLRDYIDLASWAQDRMLRGTASGVRLPQIALDALQINRWADVSALRAGDRVRVTGLPTAVFGVSYIDGWLLGGSYALRYPSLHAEDQLLFTFAFQTVLAPTAIYDTNRYMSGGDLTLSADINSSVTSISVATTGATFTTAGGDLPVNITIDSEEMTVAAATGATPQVLTVTRAQNGTAAAAHSAGALVELATASLYAF